MRSLDETAVERDLQIKLGFGSWVYLVWAYLGTIAALSLVLVVLSLLVRLVSGSLAAQRVITTDFLYTTQVIISQGFTVLTALSCLVSLPVAFVLRAFYRRRLLARAGVALPPEKNTVPTKSRKAKESD